MIDYGHWSVLKEVDPKDYLGFIYVIKFENGKKYIGAKKLWKRIKVAPSSFKRGPLRGFESSDWKTYTSSSNELNKMIHDGHIPTEYLIVGWYKTWGKTLMAEMELQLSNDVLRNPDWLNKQIGGQFNPNCFDDLTNDDIASYMAFDKGNEHTSWQTMYKIGHRTKYVKPEDVGSYLGDGWQIGRSKTEKRSAVGISSEYTLWDYKCNIPIFVRNQAEFAAQNAITPSHLTRVLNGELDFANKRFGLPPEIARKTHVCRNIVTGELFSTNKEAEDFFNKGRGGIRTLIKDGFVEKLEVEARAQYKKRLATLDLVKKVKTEKVSVLVENSFKDITNVMTQCEKEELLNWLEMYIQYIKGL